VNPAEGERRLHPGSWLFVLLQQLKQFIVPLLVLVFAGRGDRNSLWPLIGVGVLVVTSMLQYLTYRYRIGADGVTIRSGWLHRSVREIPFARLHNVALHQSLLHRLFGVAEVRLESAGGVRPEAQMRVLKLEEALALEDLVRHRGGEAAARSDAAEAPDAVLLSLPAAEVVRLGLVSNRGMVVVAAALTVVSQAMPDALLGDTLRSVAAHIFGYAGALHGGSPASLVAALGLVVAVLVVLRLLSVALAWVQYHGFRLSEARQRLTVERGLLTRSRSSTPRRRIQAWTLRETALQRWLGRRSLAIDTAASPFAQERGTMKELAPIATPQACDALIQHLLPQAQWPRPTWRPLSPSAAWRLALPGATVSLLATGLACAWWGSAWGLLALLWLPWTWFASRRHACRAGYDLDERLVAVREGWWSRHWRFAELDKLQALRLSRSPLDQRCGTATLWLDTAGADAFAPPLRIRFLPLAEAQALYARLGHLLAVRALRW